jgi:hypothetical protein
MENKKKCGTKQILQGSRFDNGNKETETPLDRPHREKAEYQSISYTEIQKGDKEQEDQESGW